MNARPSSSNNYYFQWKNTRQLIGAFENVSINYPSPRSGSNSHRNSIKSTSRRQIENKIEFPSFSTRDLFVRRSNIFSKVKHENFGLNGFKCKKLGVSSTLWIATFSEKFTTFCTRWTKMKLKEFFKSLTKIEKSIDLDLFQIWFFKRKVYFSCF